MFQKNCRDLWLSCIILVFASSRFLFGSLTALYLIYLLLFNFQGPFCLPLALRFLSSLARLIYYIIFRAVCQGVLQKFLKFFSKLFSLRFLAWRDLYIISYFWAFVKRFCKSLLKFFSGPFGYRLRFRLLCSLAHSFNIISHFFWFVKGFFKKNEKISNFCHNRVSELFLVTFP